MTRNRPTRYGFGPMLVAGGLACVYGSFLVPSWPLFFAGAAVAVLSLATWLIAIDKGYSTADGWEIPVALVIGPVAYGIFGALVMAATYSPNDPDFFLLSRDVVTVLGAIGGGIIGMAVGCGCAVLFAAEHVYQVAKARRAAAKARRAAAKSPEAPVAELNVTV